MSCMSFTAAQSLGNSFSVLGRKARQGADASRPSPPFAMPASSNDCDKVFEVFGAGTTEQRAELDALASCQLRCDCRNAQLLNPLQLVPVPGGFECFADCHCFD